MKIFSKLALIGIGLSATYHFVLREPILNWGATGLEVNSVLPGDDLLPDANGVSTRAITINAPPSAAWPWVVQIGPQPRGGVYTYDWIENLLGLKMQSTREILEEFQHPQLGESIEFGANEMVIAAIDPEHALVWRSGDGNWIWSFVLIEQNGTTRLVSRNRFRLPRVIDKVGMVPMVPASLVMERKMLLGIKERAEDLIA
jgi:hypothetical protein